MRHLTVPLFAAVVLLIGLVPSADATGYRTTYAAPVVQKVVVQEVLVVQPAYVPLYSIGYDPLSYSLAEELRFLRQELQRTRQLLQNPPTLTPEVLPNTAPPKKIQGTPLPPENPMEPLPPPEQGVLAPEEQVLNHHCASCHTGAASKKKFVVFAEPGKVDPDLNWLLVYAKMFRQEMPLDPKPKVHPSDMELVWKRANKEAAAKEK